MVNFLPICIPFIILIVFVKKKIEIVKFYIDRKRGGCIKIYEKQLLAIKEI